MNYLDKLYRMSVWILCLLTAIIFLLVTINEDITLKIAVVVAFPLLVLVLSIPSTAISRKILKKGDLIEKRVIRTLFYIALPLASLALFAVIAKIMYAVEDSIPSTGDFATELGRALIFLFILCAMFICVLLPHIQTYIVLILRKLIKAGAAEEASEKEI